MATSEVENLLEDIDRDLGDCNKAPDCSYFHNRMVDLIAAAHAEGVAEGAEQEREREIQVTCGVCGHTWKGVLAPTKEVAR